MRMLCLFSSLFFLSLTWSRIALSEVETPRTNTELNDEISDGKVIQLEDFRIQTVSGWKISRNKSGMALTLEEVRQQDAQPVYDKPTYLRNITVTRIGRASPIDQERLESFKSEMTARFTKELGVHDFQISESKVTKIADGRDAILVFAQFKMNAVLMMQVHLLISNDKKQYLLTYTDMAERFSSNDGSYQTAWASLQSIDVGGPAPSRPNYALYGFVIALVLAFLGVAKVILGRRARKRFEETAEILFNDHDETSEIAAEISTFGTMANGWNLNGPKHTH